jgi:hypothetical protein
MANRHGLVEFKDYVGDKGGAAKHIRAADLDNNFRRLTPLNPDGKAFFTPTDGGMTYQTVTIDVCVDGVVRQLTVIGVLS